MKHRNIIRFIFAAVAVAASGVWAETETVGDYTWTYRINGETAEIYGELNGAYYSMAISPMPMGIVTIPDTLGGKPVTSIGQYAFYYCSSMTSVKIPEGVTRIGYGAFNNCRSLTSVTIPSSVTNIGSSAFSGCSGLKSVHIDDLTTWCKVDLGSSYANPLFYARNLYVGGKLVTDLMIPDGVIRIGQYAFQNCTNLTNVTVPNSVASIGYSAFSGCSGLTHITLPFVGSQRGNSGSYNSLFGYIFGTSSYTGGRETQQYYNSSSCYSYYIPETLKSVTITDETVLAYGAFYNCSWLTSVIIPDGVTNIGPYAFYCCFILKNVTIPNGVTDIGDYAFYYCSSLPSVTIPNGVTSIGRYAFYNCYRLTSVTIPDSVTSIGSSAFSGCSGVNDVIAPQCVYTNRMSAIFPSAYQSITNIVVSYGVTNIGNSAFSNCSELINVTIPDSVTSIGAYAFNGCESLVSVMIPDSVTSVGNFAFCNCGGLTSMTIPESVTDIGDSVFSGCNALKSFTVADGNPCYKAVSGLLLTRDGKTLVAVPDGLTSVTIPDSVIRLGDSVFYSSISLTSVTIPGSVTNIGDRVFSNCTNLMIAAMGDGVQNIGNYAFSGCSMLENVTIPDSVANIGEGAFSNCTNLMIVTMGNGVQNIGDYAFSGCSKLAYVTIPNSVKSIGTYTFSDCSGLRDVTIPQCVCITGMSSVFPTAYQSITNVIISYGVTNIGDSVFADCSGLASVTIPDGVTSIGVWAFYGCSGLTSMAIPDSVTNVGDGAFSGCSGLTSVTIPNSVTNIGATAFFCCSGLTSVTIPDSVTSIGPSAFCGCSGLMSVTIPDGVTSIGASAFSGCSGLTDVTIPVSVTNIGNAAFSYCKRLTSVTIGNSVTNIGDGAFYGCSGIASVSIPQCVCSSRMSLVFPSAYQTMTNVVVGAEVEILSDGLLDGCDALERLAFLSAETKLGMNDLKTVGKLYENAPDGYWVVQNALVGYKGVCPGMIPYLDTIKCVMPGALECCTALTDLTFTVESVLEDIGTNAFKQCTELRSMTLPPSLNGIGDEAFMGCSYLGNVIVPGSVTRIGDRAFKNCTGFTAAQIEYGVEIMGKEAFYGDWQIREVDIPSTVTNIGEMAFGGDSSMVRIGLRGDVRKASEIFSHYASIREATVKAGDGEIVDGLFSGFVGLRDVHFLGNCPELENEGQTIYYKTPEDSANVVGLTTYVERDSTGWDGTPGSHSLPQAWPLKGARRSIAWWDVPTYLVKFDSNGGTLGIQETYQYSEQFFALPPEPVQTGYSFAGWWTQPVGGLPVTEDTIFIEGVYTYLYAHWRKGHWVFLDPAGGTVANDFVTYVEQTVYGVLPVPVKSGYAFGGWMYNGYKIEPETEINETADHTLVAQWKANIYSVRYNPNGGVGEMEGQGFVYGVNQTLRKNLFTCAGHVFSGWATNETGGVVYEDCEVVSNLTAVADGWIELYAVWEESDEFDFTLGTITLNNLDDMKPIRFSNAWSGQVGVSESAEVVVTLFKTAINETTVLTNAVGSGLIDWAPERADTYVLTHQVYDGGVAVGHALELTIVVPGPGVTISPADGTTFETSQTITISATDGAKIYYTTDGSEPTTASVPYKRFRINGKTTVKAIAVADGLPWSETAVARYALGTAANPVIEPSDGTVFGASQEVSIHWSDADGAVRYTLDGSEPTEESALYEGPFTIRTSCTVKAKVFGKTLFDSAVVAAEFRQNWTIGIALDCIGLDFETPVGTGWMRDSSVSCFLGGESMRSGRIGDDEVSVLSTAVPTAGRISFKWRTSCEADEYHEWDRLELRVDGESVLCLDGDSGWQDGVWEFADGPHTVEWVYVKDAAESDGEDCAWLDYVTWTPAGGSGDVSVDMGGGKSVTVPGDWLTNITERIESAGGDIVAALQATAANGRLSVAECYVLGVDPEVAEEDFKITSITIGADGKPVVEFEPPQAKWNVPGARAVLKGAERLEGPWGEVGSAGGESAYRFFKVEVVLP